MWSSLCLSRNPLLWVFAAPVLAMVVAANLGFGFSSISITSSVLILSTALMAMSRQKPGLVRGLVKESELHKNGSLLVDQVLSDLKQDPQNEIVTQKGYAQEGLEKEFPSKQNHKRETNCGYLVRPSLDSLSEIECLDHSSTSEDTDEKGWPFHADIGGDSPEYSVGSISEEEGLIEISLPNGQYVAPSEELETDGAKVLIYQQELPDLSDGRMEMLLEINEMNEEENLIEIDISGGSIKCSRFEIEA